MSIRIAEKDNSLASPTFDATTIPRMVQGSRPNSNRQVHQIRSVYSTRSWRKLFSSCSSVASRKRSAMVSSSQPARYLRYLPR